MLAEAIGRAGLMIACAEAAPAEDGDGVAAAMRMVGESQAYVGIIGHRYGQVLPSQLYNPHRLSLAELEYQQALEQGLPILVFIMGDKHPVTIEQVELDPGRRKKLEQFRDHAKQRYGRGDSPGAYHIFENLDEFAAIAPGAVRRLAETLPKIDIAERPPPPGPDEVARPPRLAAFPRYLASHAFVGRAAQLQTLDDWCSDADPKSVMLFEAMGGSGKSILAWEWVSAHAQRSQGGCAGYVWYSFYDSDTGMADFCRRTLAYMDGRAPEAFHGLDWRSLSTALVQRLEERRWVLVLDGLERLLVAYHRSDAASLAAPDEQISAGQLDQRDPCAAIRPEDDDFLRRLSAIAPSKVLITSRLTPLALINQSHNPLPGVRREILPGLRPADAEALLLSCGVTGDSDDIRAYLQTNCDCHPLVVGVLAGLINDFKPNPGNFDAWKTAAGGNLNLENLDLRQRRNHILRQAIERLDGRGRRLLENLALLQASADYATLMAICRTTPNLPEPEAPEGREDWPSLPADRRNALEVEHQRALAFWQAQRMRLAMRNEKTANRIPPEGLDAVIDNLERRGLLQFDASSRRYDLHPVVRAVVAGQMEGGAEGRSAHPVNGAWRPRQSFLAVKASPNGVWMTALPGEPAVSAHVSADCATLTLYWPHSAPESHFARYFSRLLEQPLSAEREIKMYFDDRVLLEEWTGEGDEDDGEGLIPANPPEDWKSNARSVSMEIRPTSPSNTAAQRVWYVVKRDVTHSVEAGVALERVQLQSSLGDIRDLVERTHEEAFEAGRPVDANLNNILNAICVEAEALENEVGAGL
ncbi:hypothetical protein QO010_000151 [Caulobacter ginsengisoli]|uniref:DUF4062 domain-containing protein n=1 Tax=Caulobacter ginsengisoli TaxID=400775 RepID=A0ABU0IMM2_9CAUL|nr:hypothetical protein [Caulobacter ginsengisoli]